MSRARRFLLLTTISSAAAAWACVGDNPPPAEVTTPEAGAEGSVPPGTPPPPPPGADAGSDAGQRHCATTVAPAGAAEFFCADFDGPDAAEGWTASAIDDGGVLDATTSLAFSTPRSLFAHAVDGQQVGGGFSPPGLGGVYSWDDVAGAAFTEISIHARLNPAPSNTGSPYVGKVRVLAVYSTDVAVELAYTRGGTGDGGPTGYVGWFVQVRSVGVGGAVLQRYPALVQLEPSVWTDVKLVWQATGQISLTFNGISVVTALSGGGTTATGVSASAGATAFGEVKLSEAVAIDDVEVSVRR